MSRIGKLPIPVTDKTEITIDGRDVVVKGPKGEMALRIHPLIEVASEDSQLTVTPKRKNKQAKAMWGLWRSLLANAVTGVNEGFKKELELVGVGYRVQKKGTGLELAVGYSHKVDFEAPENVSLDVDDGKIVVSGIDKQIVGQTAAKLRAVRPPEPYKGKGIRYVGERIILKPGKAGKGVAA